MTIQRLGASSAAVLALSLVVAGAAPAAAQGAFPAPLPNQAAQPGSDSSPFPPVNARPAAAPKAAASSAPAASPFPPVNSSAPAAPQAGASPFPPAGGSASVGAAPGSFPVNGAAPAGLGLGAGGMGAPAAAAPNQQECVTPFTALRNEAERRANLIRVASQRKAPAQEACRLIADFAQAEMKLISFVKAKQQTCGIPAAIGQQMSQGHAKTEQLRKNVCAAAANGGAPQGGPPAPSLSEAIGSPVVPEAPAAKRSSGGGMFDTLSGNVLAR